MRVAVFIMWLLHFLPLPILGRIGKGFGTVMYYFMKRRRNICMTNLRVCFPRLSERGREIITKAHFQDYGRSIFERGILWWGSRERIEKLLVVDPPFPTEEVKNGPVIFICPHFVCLEIPGVVLTMNTAGCSIYTEQKNPVFDELLRRGRVRFSQDSVLVSRSAGVKPIIRALHKNMPFYMLPDMDFGRRDAEFVPFFGEPAATLVAPSRLAAVTGAKVMPVIASFLPNYQGWKVSFYPAWENFPEKDNYTSALRMNKFIEDRIREIPSQYLWTHRRFKTRPEGAPPIYAEEDNIKHSRRKR